VGALKKNMEEKWIFLIAGAAIGSINNLVFSQLKRAVYLIKLKNYLDAIVLSSTDQLVSEFNRYKDFETKLKKNSGDLKLLKIGKTTEISVLDKVPILDLISIYDKMHLKFMDLISYRNYFSVHGLDATVNDYIQKSKKC
jgi:hypothetical protein